jgi:hypothetical protein
MSKSPPRYEVRSRKSGHARVTPLALYWEVNGDPITDDYLPEEATAVGLWDEWLAWRERQGEGWEARISWHVRGDGIAEAAPGQDVSWGDFLEHYYWPHDVATGDNLQWTRLPVVDKLWQPGRADKGGFIQEATGWKPGAFQDSVNLDLIAQLAGLTRPRPRTQGTD